MKKIILFLLICFSTLPLKAQDYASDRSKSYITAQDFVKEKFRYPQEIKFNSSIVHETQSYRKCTILGKLTAKNAFGVRSEYTYKIWLTHKGGEWEDKDNWIYSKLVIEDTSTGEQQIFTNETKNTATIAQSKETKFLGLNCLIVEDTGSAIRIQTPRKFKRSEINKGITTFQYKDSRKIIQFCVKGKIQRGEEYAAKIGKEVFMYE